MTSDPERAKQIAQEIAALGPVLPGTLSERYLTCRSAGCHCHDEEPELHGPYWYWTRKVDQKTVSKLLSAEQVPEYAQWFANRHRLRELTHELEELAIATVEADPRTPRRGQKRAAS
jgi:hypothetical protein